MAKRLSSVYQPGERSKDWLKVKVTFDADVVIVGWTEGEGSRAGSLGSLMMAVYDDGDLRYVGNVGTGFGRDSSRRHHDRSKPSRRQSLLLRLRCCAPDLSCAVPIGCQPSLVAMVEHRG